MREEIIEAENTPNDIEVLRRHSALDIVLIPEGLKPVSGQENALNLIKQMWSVFDVETNYQSLLVRKAFFDLPESAVRRDCYLLVLLSVQGTEF